MSKDILPTVDKQANTYHELQSSIYKTSKLDTNVLRDSIKKADRIAYMRQEFDTIRRETKGQLKIVEKDQSSGGTNVIFRKEVGGKLSGKGTERLFHGQTVELVGNEKNEGGYYEIGEGRNGEKHVYIKVKTQNGETGFIAAEHLGYDKIPNTSSTEPETGTMPKKGEQAPAAPTGLVIKNTESSKTGTGKKAPDKVDSSLNTGTGKDPEHNDSVETGTGTGKKDDVPPTPGTGRKAQETNPSLETGTGKDPKSNNPRETGTGNAKKNSSPVDTGTGNPGKKENGTPQVETKTDIPKQGNTEEFLKKAVPKKVETPAEKTKREQEVRKQLQEMKQKLKKGADTVSGIAKEAAKGLGASASSILDRAYNLKKNGDKVKAEKFQESWKKETAMPESGNLLRKTETPQTAPKKQQEKPRPGIMRGLDDIKRTDATISTEKPLEKTDSGKTDKDGYIWVPEMHDSLTTTPPEVRPFKNKAELAQDLGRGLVSTFDALNINQNMKDAVNNLLIDQNFNLRLDPSLANITDFTFNGKNIESRQGSKQEITELAVQGKTLIFNLKNEAPLIFAPPTN